jgi:type II secretory pathway component GspD/PulD (secretin)
VTQAYGVTAIFDDSVAAKRVRFEVENVDFFKAMELAGSVTHTFFSPLSDKEVLIAADTVENHRQFDQMALRTFYVGGVTAPQELTELVTVLRTMFEIKFLTQQPGTSTLVMRAPRPVLEAATQFLNDLGDARPEVMLDVTVYEVSNTLTRNMGLHIPNQFTMFNIPAGALLALGGQNIQDLINQLISSGGINQANSQALSGLLAQLQNQQSSIFSQPIATFGGGLTLMGLSLGTLSAQLQLNESNVKTLEHATLRATQGKDTSLKIGSRYPILNASFAPVFNSAAISQNIQNNTFQPAFPSFNYEDLGLTVKAKPTVHGDEEVSLDLEMQFRVLGTTSLNGVPVISNREYKGSIGLKDDEPAVIAGMISHSELRSLNGIPGLGSVPLLNSVAVTNSKENNEDELLIVITPHISRAARQHPESAPWITTAK